MLWNFKKFEDKPNTQHPRDYWTTEACLGAENSRMMTNEELFTYASIDGCETFHIPLAIAIEEMMKSSEVYLFGNKVLQVGIFYSIVTQARTVTQKIQFPNDEKSESESSSDDDDSADDDEEEEFSTHVLLGIEVEKGMTVQYLE